MNPFPSENEIAVSVFIKTFELPRQLELVCAGFENQDTDEFEILFCDPGSGATTKAVIDEARRRLRGRVTVEHIWLENQGHLRARVMNQALRQARGRIFIFMDGDGIPHRSFVRDHLQSQEEGTFLSGHRMELGPWLSAFLTPEQVRAGFFNRPRWPLISSSLRMESGPLRDEVRIPWMPLRKILKESPPPRFSPYHYSVTRNAIEAINGFDESSDDSRGAWGREDFDVAMRLQNLGLKLKFLKGLALQFRVWHPRGDSTTQHGVRSQQSQVNDKVRCERGWYRD
jgi:glycosyltransferase involved in cell wall biosynthesis